MCKLRLWKGATNVVGAGYFLIQRWSPSSLPQGLPSLVCDLRNTQRLLKCSRPQGTRSGENSSCYALSISHLPFTKAREEILHSTQKPVNVNPVWFWAREAWRGGGPACWGCQECAGMLVQMWQALQGTLSHSCPRAVSPL